MTEGKTKTLKKVKGGRIPHNLTEVNGIKFHSKMESKYYKEILEKMENKTVTDKGVIVNIELQPEFLLQEKFIIIDGKAIFESHPDFNRLKRKHEAKTIRAIKYKSDFKITYDTGEVRIVDTKGKSTADFELKRKIFMAKYPDLKLDVVTEYKGHWVNYYQHELDKKKKKDKKEKK